MSRTSVRNSMLSPLGFDYAYAEGPGAHTWDYWDARIQDILSELGKINPKICCK